MNSIEFLPSRPYMGLYGISGEREIEGLPVSEVGGSAFNKVTSWIHENRLRPVLPLRAALPSEMQRIDLMRRISSNRGGVSHPPGSLGAFIEGEKKPPLGWFFRIMVARGGFEPPTPTL